MSLQEPHGVTSQKTAFFIVTAVKISNLTWCFINHRITGFVTLSIIWKSKELENTTFQKLDLFLPSIEGKVSPSDTWMHHWTHKEILIKHGILLVLNSSDHIYNPSLSLWIFTFAGSRWSCMLYSMLSVLLLYLKLKSIEVLNILNSVLQSWKFLNKIQNHTAQKILFTRWRIHPFKINNKP
jgi:hypothetical protein